jgi:hypothetical protein
MSNSMFEPEQEIPEDSILFVDGRHGQYVPQRFALSITREYVQGLEPEDWTILEAGPEDELYWDVWAGMLDNCEVTINHDGKRYEISQIEGDLWFIPLS